MATLPPGARVIDPQAEADRWAAERLHGVEKVLHVGDVVRVYGSSGEVYVGRIVGVDAHAVPHPSKHAFGVICVPVEEGKDG